MESSEQQNAASNRWYKRRIVPVINEECQVALRYLQRHTQGKPIGNPESFAHSTMQACEFAAREIARSLVADSSVSLERRASAMSSLVSYALVYPLTVVEVAKADIKRLLQENTADNLWAQVEMVRLTRALAFSADLWPDINEYIETALGHIGKNLKIEMPRSLNSPAIVIEAADKCMRVLRVLMSQPPNKESSDKYLL